MPITNALGGLASYGMPVIPGVFDSLNRYWGGGQVIWVGNRSDLPAGDGTDPTRPFSSLAGTGGALASLNATTSRGHVIFCLPGHAESVSGADWLSAQGAADTFAVVGLGMGSARPTFSFSATTSTILMDQPNVNLDNLIFQGTGTIACVAPMTVSAANVGVRNCFWSLSDTGATANKMTTALTLASGADDFTLENCTMISGATTSPTDVVTNTAAVARAKFYNNYIAAKLATTEGVITMGAAMTDVRIFGCQFYNTVASSTVALKGFANSTGFINNCLLNVAAGTVTDMNGSTLPYATMAAAFNTPAGIGIGADVLVARAGKVGVLAGTVVVTV